MPLLSLFNPPSHVLVDIKPRLFPHKLLHVNEPIWWQTTLFAVHLQRILSHRLHEATDLR